MWDSNIPLLFQLPSAWLDVVLSEWLDIPSIGKLDIAVSSKTHRPQFLLSLQDMRSTCIDRFSIGFSTITASKRGWGRWLSVRQIYIESITLFESDVQSNLAIRSIQNVDVIGSFQGDDLYFLVRNFPSLRKLSLQDTDNNILRHNGFRMLTNLHQSLEELTIEKWSQYHDKFTPGLVDVLRQCTRLRKVSLVGGATCSIVNPRELLPYGHLFHELAFEDERRRRKEDDYGESIANLLTTCCNLRKVSFLGSDTDRGIEQDSLVLTALQQSCPLLEELDLANVSVFALTVDFVVTDFFTLINRNCKHLRVLSLCIYYLSATNIRSIAEMGALKYLTLDTCEGLNDRSIAVLATMHLSKLTILSPRGDDDDDEFGYLPAASLLPFVESFVESSISETLESLTLSDFPKVSIDDVQLAMVIASCRNLKTLDLEYVGTVCVFGRNGLTGLHAMAKGCPSLSEVSLYLTVNGIHCLGTHFANLKKCSVNVLDDLPPAKVPSEKDLQTLYPAVQWTFS